ncbi:T9SS type A sorting domain-containing protein [Seonamhaeicola sp. ML3]|uniref:T9SS type A sorting domain-containing protein n=1 Tax=Seonamhaeicola sp. ML3 TaxID=2937786 RepID=UPI0020103536|nr:T9SS type A sorting domain-containing protein [Seonamhaeicola sp. ML3]
MTKKITLIIICLFVYSVGYTQTQLLNLTFDSALPSELRNNTGATYASESTLTWSNTVGNPAGSMAATGIVDDGNGTSEGRSFQYLYEDAMFDFGTSGTLEISFDIKIDAALPNTNLQFQTQVSKIGGGVVVVNNENIQNSATIGGGWTKLTFNMTPNPSEFDTNGNLLIFFWNMATAPIDGSGGAFEVDNIVVTASAATPTCSDGIQNGDETGVDCGGSSCAPCIADPTSAPAEIGSSGTDVYIYSGLASGGESDLSNFTFASFFGGGVTQSEVDLNGNKVGKLEGLGFFGSGWTSYDATSSTFVHLDYYATSGTFFEFYLIDNSLANVQSICCGNPQEPRYVFGPTGNQPLVLGTWTSVFIPLSDFENFPALVAGTWDGADIVQSKFTGDGTVYFDNIYFSSSNTLSQEENQLSRFRAYPNPTNKNWAINAGNNTRIERIEIFDILGKSIKILSPNSDEVLIDSTNLKSGLYLAKIKTRSGISNLKLVKR